MPTVSVAITLWLAQVGIAHKTVDNWNPNHQLFPVAMERLLAVRRAHTGDKNANLHAVKGLRALDIRVQGPGLRA